MREILENPLYAEAYSNGLNAASVIFQNRREGEAGAQDILMTGDAPPEILEGLTEKLYDGYNILKAPHHGTASAYCSLFADMSFAHILISNGEYHAGGAVAQAYIDREESIRHCTNHNACKWYGASGACCNRLCYCYDQERGPGLVIKCRDAAQGGGGGGCAIRVVLPQRGALLLVRRALPLTRRELDETERNAALQHSLSLLVPLPRMAGTDLWCRAAYCAGGNLAIDSLVVLLAAACMKLPEKAKLWRQGIVKVWLLGFACDAGGAVFTAFCLGLVRAATGHRTTLPVHLLCTVPGVALAGVLLYWANRKLSFRKAGLEEKQLHRMCLAIALCTAPYLMLCAVGIRNQIIDRQGQPVCFLLYPCVVYCKV